MNPGVEVEEETGDANAAEKAVLAEIARRAGRA